MDGAALDALRSRIRTMERMRPASAEAVPLHPRIDPALPWRGLPLACLHQVLAGDAAGTAFCAMIAGRLARGLERPVVWCLTGDDLYLPGLGLFGLEPHRLLLARARNDVDVMWVMEESLRSGAAACVVGEVRTLDSTAGRRLQLAAEAGGVTGLALHPGSAAAGNVGTTRWRVSSAPGGRRRLALERCRNGMPGEWEVELL